MNHADNYGHSPLSLITGYMELCFPQFGKWHDPLCDDLNTGGHLVFEATPEDYAKYPSAQYMGEHRAGVLQLFDKLVEVVVEP